MGITIGIEFFRIYAVGVGLSLITGSVLLVAKEKKLNPIGIFIVGAILLAVGAFLFGLGY